MTSTEISNTWTFWTNNQTDRKTTKKNWTKYGLKKFSTNKELILAKSDTFRNSQAKWGILNVEFSHRFVEDTIHFIQLGFFEQTTIYEQNWKFLLLWCIAHTDLTSHSVLVFSVFSCVCTITIKSFQRSFFRKFHVHFLESISFNQQAVKQLISFHGLNKHGLFDRSMYLPWLKYLCINKRMNLAKNLVNLKHIHFRLSDAQFYHSLVIQPMHENSPFMLETLRWRAYLF